MKATLNDTFLTAPTEDCWGFFGTIKSNEEIDEATASQAWADAFRIFRSAPWQPSDIAIRNFLRVRWGRHFADATSFYEGTLAERIQQASGEKWVAQEFARMKHQGTDQQLLEDDPLNQ
ncbi:MAG: hypothetical protein V2I43_27025 [Parvularcula sp.]|jgi:hypothetical protein|nr:hypothetical protein [Parvularcula sp.]